MQKLSNDDVTLYDMIWWWTSG